MRTACIKHLHFVQIEARILNVIIQMMIRSVKSFSRSLLLIKICKLRITFNSHIFVVDAKIALDARANE